MKSGLLPLCHEAMVLGPVTYYEYGGSGLLELQSIRQALGSASQVYSVLHLFLIRVVTSIHVHLLSKFCFQVPFIFTYLIVFDILSIQCGEVLHLSSVDIG